ELIVFGPLAGALLHDDRYREGLLRVIPPGPPEEQSWIGGAARAWVLDEAFFGNVELATVPPPSRFQEVRGGVFRWNRDGADVFTRILLTLEPPRLFPVLAFAHAGLPQPQRGEVGHRLVGQELRQ